MQPCTKSGEAPHAAGKDRDWALRRKCSHTQQTGRYRGFQVISVNSLHPNELIPKLKLHKVYDYDTVPET